MTQRSTPSAVRRGADRLFEAIGLRPIGLLVFLVSAAIFIELVLLPANALQVSAVAVAEGANHPAHSRSHVEELFVRAGDRVEAGMPLARLSARYVDDRVARIELEIKELEGEARLAAEKLRVREERWVEPGLRRRPTAPSLEGPTLDYYAGQLDVLRARHADLLAERDALVVRSRRAGIIAELLDVGDAVDRGTSVASVVPRFAEEVVAYLPAESVPERIPDGATAHLRDVAGPHCDVAIGSLRRGARVEQAPLQLREWLRFPVVGLPIHFDVPASCALGVGQVVSVEIRFGATG